MKDHSLENTNFDIHRQIHTHMKLIATKPNICSNNGGTQDKRKDKMKLSLPSKLMKKLV